MNQVPVMLLPACACLFLLTSCLTAQDPGVSASVPYPVPAEKKMMVWDGDELTRGGGWVHPKEGVALKAQTDEAHHRKVALEFSAENPQGWVGGGWNWHGWYPADAGNDISGKKNISLWAKFAGRKKAEKITISLSCSSTKKPTAQAELLKYCPDLLDGRWHEIVIPIQDFVGTNGFDPRKAWEIDLGVVPAKGQSFSLYVDEIGFDDRALSQSKKAE